MGAINELLELEQVLAKKNKLEKIRFRKTQKIMKEINLWLHNDNCFPQTEFEKVYNKFYKETE
jgi:hypothetical protein